MGTSSFTDRNFYSQLKWYHLMISIIDGRFTTSLTIIHLLKSKHEAFGKARRRLGELSKEVTKCYAARVTGSNGNSSSRALLLPKTFGWNVKLITHSWKPSNSNMIIYSMLTILVALQSILSFVAMSLLTSVGESFSNSLWRHLRKPGW